MKYLTLFSLELLHSYYVDRRCPDFQIEPTPETQKLLKDSRCVLKPFPNGIHILILVDGENAPFIPLPVGAIFGFHLRLQNPDFILFTDLTAISQTAAPLYTNATTSTSGDLTLVSREAWSTEHFIVQRPDPKEPFTLAGCPLESIKTAGMFIVKGLGQKTGHKRYDEDARILMVNSTAASPGTPFTVTYPVAPRLKQGVFADIEIKYDKPMTRIAGGAAKFQVVFKAKQVRWKYYIVTNKAENKSNIPAIEDKDKVIIFDAAGQTDLTKAPDPDDKIANELAKQYPNMQTFRFLSNALISCQEAARKSIQFQLNGDKVVDALPNPALQNYVVDVKGSQKEDGLYHIVKYFTH